MVRKNKQMVNYIVFKFFFFWSKKGFIFFLIYTLLKYSWLTMFQVHSKLIQLYICTYIIFQIIFHYRLLQDTDYSSLDYTVNLCCFLHTLFLIRNLAFSSY